ncbi:hypothetical protein [Dyadobacter luticola]|uniref:Uncharacterized protein n=1 Tax=Dyadobacter luticola TaxID=1979387 RepID=A0A5R9L2M1_9BACT|nr:hypothetical protein [Dyadobacter luticola]TLV02545.1 hypothetical protein FEN17_02680 [Dyadobacter luticola]
MESLATTSPEFCEPLDNTYGDIPEQFGIIKGIVSNAMYEMSEVMDILELVMKETDPLKALTLSFEINSGLADGYGSWGKELANALWDQHFYSVCKEHKEKIDFLKSNHILDRFILARQELQEAIVRFLCDNLPQDQDLVHRVVITFLPDTLRQIQVQNSLIHATKYWDTDLQFDQRFNRLLVPESCGTRKIEAGQVEIFWMPAIYLESERKFGKLSVSIEDFYRVTDFIIYAEGMEGIYNSLMASRASKN